MNIAILNNDIEQFDHIIQRRLFLTISKNLFTILNDQSSLLVEYLSNGYFYYWFNYSTELQTVFVCKSNKVIAIREYKNPHMPRIFSYIRECKQIAYDERFLDQSEVPTVEQIEQMVQLFERKVLKK